MRVCVCVCFLNMCVMFTAILTHDSSLLYCYDCVVNFSIFTSDD